MAVGHAHEVHIHGVKADGNAPTVVVNAYKVTGGIADRQDGPPRSDREPALTFLLGVVLAIPFACDGAQLGSPAADRWAAACLVLRAAASAVLVRGRRRSRPRNGLLSPEDLRTASASLAGTLAEQYAWDENGVRLYDPGPLPVRWAAAPRGIGDQAAREVLERIRRTHGLPAGPVPGGAPLAGVERSRTSEASGT